MKKETAGSVETFRKPEVNKRNENLNGGKEVVLGGRDGGNPGENSFRVVGFNRSVSECCEIGTDFIG